MKTSSSCKPLVYTGKVMCWWWQESLPIHSRRGLCWRRHWCLVYSLNDLMWKRSPTKHTIPIWDE